MRARPTRFHPQRSSPILGLRLRGRGCRRMKAGGGGGQEADQCKSLIVPSTRGVIRKKEEKSSRLRTGHPDLSAAACCMPVQSLRMGADSPAVLSSIVIVTVEPVAAQPQSREDLGARCSTMPESITLGSLKVPVAGAASALPTPRSTSIKVVVICAAITTQAMDFTVFRSATGTVLQFFTTSFTVSVSK